MADINSVNIAKVGSVELKDNGFTSNCHEDDVLAQLKVEAFYARGQLINNLEEKRTDVKVHTIAAGQIYIALKMTVY